MAKSIGPKRIVIDASHTYGSGLNSGIQRVVRNTCQMARPASRHSEIETVICRKGRWWIRDLCNEKNRTATLHQWRTNPLAMMPGKYQFVAELICKLLPARLIRKWLLPAPGHLGAFKLPLKAYSKWVDAQEKKAEIELGAEDLLLLPDAYWAKEEVWPAVNAAKKRGAKVAVVLYDLIPLTHPHFVSAKAYEPFKQYLRNVAKHADVVIAISETVRKQVQELFRTPEFACENDCSFASFELGAEFAAKDGEVREHIRALFPQDANNAPHLMVATFDPRKNHNFVLDAFEKVWEKCPDRKLCFVGRVGWLCDDVIQRIQQHPKFGERLFALHDITDVELHYCYQRARSILMPSIVEGFGLPIAEALWHQRHVFASDTEIHREVGRDECEYFGLNAPIELAEKIVEWEAQFDDNSPRRYSSYRPVSWEESISSLVQQCTNRLFPHRSQTEKQAA